MVRLTAIIGREAQGYEEHHDGQPRGWNQDQERHYATVAFLIGGAAVERDLSRSLRGGARSGSPQCGHTSPITHSTMTGTTQAAQQIRSSTASSFVHQGVEVQYGFDILV